MEILSYTLGLDMQKVMDHVELILHSDAMARKCRKAGDTRGFEKYVAEYQTFCKDLLDVNRFSFSNEITHLTRTKQGPRLQRQDEMLLLLKENIPLVKRRFRDEIGYNVSDYEGEIRGRARVELAKKHAQPLLTGGLAVAAVVMTILAARS